jgi:hypothetical protein
MHLLRGLFDRHLTGVKPFMDGESDLGADLDALWGDVHFYPELPGLVKSIKKSGPLV